MSSNGNVPALQAQGHGFKFWDRFLCKLLEDSICFCMLNPRITFWWSLDGLMPLFNFQINGFYLYKFQGSVFRSFRIEHFVHSYDQACMKMQVLCLFGKRCVYVLFCLNILEGGGPLIRVLGLALNLWPTMTIFDSLVW